jgi:hypothetical protein
MFLPLFQSGEIKLFLKGLQSFSLGDVKAKHFPSLWFFICLKLKNKNPYERMKQVYAMSLVYDGSVLLVNL